MTLRSGRAPARRDKEIVMDAYDEDDPDDDEFEVAEEWTEGECDHCFGGEPTPSPFGPIYCACQVGQGAPPELCVCGPED